MKTSWRTVAAATTAYATVRWAVRRWRASRYALAGRVVLITGGSRGLGLLLAREYARQGAALVLAARDASELERACMELRNNGAQVIGVPCDVTRKPDVFALIETVITYYGKLDIVVNDAGRVEVGPVQAMTVTDFENAMNTNFWGAFNVINAALPELARSGGRIVNISSVGGLVSVPHLVPYSASKFALTGLSLGLGVELARKGIVVVTVCPGLMRTGSPVNALFKGDSSAEYAWFSVADSLPLLSISGERAARAIVSASRRGDAILRLGVPAKLAGIINGLFPALVARASAQVVRWLPQAEDTKARRGADVEHRPAAWLTSLGDKAAVMNNELR